MKLLQRWRQSDSFKAAVLLAAAALFFAGSGIRAAAVYAAWLQRPTEYICTAEHSLQQAVLQLEREEQLCTYSRQKTAELRQGDKSLSVTLLSGAYLADCCGLPETPRTIFANAEAIALLGLTETTVPFQGTLNGSPFSAEIVCTDALPFGEPHAMLAVSAAELHDADTLRICLNAPDPSLPGRCGLRIQNPEVQCTAEYETKLCLLRIRFSAVCVLLALIGAAGMARKAIPF